MYPLALALGPSIFNISFTCGFSVCNFDNSVVAKFCGGAIASEFLSLVSFVSNASLSVIGFVVSGAMGLGVSDLVIVEVDFIFYSFGKTVVFHKEEYRTETYS